MITLEQVYKLIEKADDIDLIDGNRFDNYRLSFNTGDFILHHSYYLDTGTEFKLIDKANKVFIELFDKESEIKGILRKLNNTMIKLEKDALSTHYQEALNRIDKILGDE